MLSIFFFVIEIVFRMGRMIGQGSFGVVFEAESVKTKEKLAVKKVNKEKVIVVIFCKNLTIF